jgi:hypothetical protein
MGQKTVRKRPAYLCYDCGKPVPMNKVTEQRARGPITYHVIAADQLFFAFGRYWHEHCTPRPIT